MSVLIHIDERSGEPVFRQIMDRIVEMVESGVLNPGDRLPSSRGMAERLGVNRSTVYRAYQELWSLGYLESRPGSYSVIRNRTRVVQNGPASSKSRIPWASRTSVVGEDLYEAYLMDEELIRRAGGSDLINFIPLSPDSRLFPTEAFRKSMNRVLGEQGGKLLQYGHPQGYEPLREYIAGMMRRHGVPSSAGEIMITTGAQNGIELMLKLLADPGSSVAFESPTYARAIDVFRLFGVKLVGVPMTDEGLDLDALEDRLEKEMPAFIYTIPNFHNPTGITTSQDHREKLLEICERHSTPLVEDGFEEEMKYFGKAVMPIKSMDHGGVVVYLGTFSKVLFPGLRIGWIAADRACIDRLVPIQRTTIVAGNLLDQAALDRFCRAGHYDLHMRRMHRVYRKRMRAALNALQANMDLDRVEWTKPAGGYTIWVRLKNTRLGEKEIVDRLYAHGVAVLPGSTHFHGPSNGPFFRLSIGHLDEPAIEEGIRRLAEGLNEPE